ncbi:hypothetical protein QFZ99_006065 [Paraburkholderia atlantica]|uniref:hypothetical protein n=1 Tax=Paraburkholderia atlantica TaxID=2654982 RepID=UPI003D20DCF4
MTGYLKGDARRLYEAAKALCEPGERDFYLDLAETLADVYRGRARVAWIELVQTGLITMHETYATLN